MINDYENHYIGALTGIPFLDRFWFCLLADGGDEYSLSSSSSLMISFTLFDLSFISSLCLSPNRATTLIIQKINVCIYPKQIKNKNKGENLERMTDLACNATIEWIILQIPITNNATTVLWINLLRLLLLLLWWLIPLFQEQNFCFICMISLWKRKCNFIKIKKINKFSS